MATVKKIADFLKLDIKEFSALVIATLVLAFAFSYRFRGPFSFSNWFGNFLLILVLVILSFAVREFVQRYIAQRYLAKITLKPFLSGFIATIITTVISGGTIIFAAPWVVTITSHYITRPGRVYSKWHLGPYESAKIALAGPLANLGLAIAAKLLSPSLGYVAERLIFINVSMAIFNLIPIFTLFPFTFLPSLFSKTPVQMIALKKGGTPYLEGDIVFFGSRPLWAFMFIFILVAGLSLFYLSASASLILAFGIGAIIWLLWHYYFEGAKPKP